VSSDLQIAFNPESTYRRLVSEHVPPSWARVVTRLCFLVLAFAVIVPILATHVITIRLVLVSAAAWCFVPLIQTAMALAIIGPARGRRVGLARACELWFAGHLPYTAWILLLPIIFRLGYMLRFNLLLVTFAAAMSWAAFVEAAYCRAVLGASPSDARWSVAVHQMLMLTLTCVGVVWAAGGWESITGFLARTAAQLLA
jgi:hypothetical protein